MSTDFFDRQAAAQRKTKLLIFYFVLAVAGIILVLHIAVALALGLSLLDWELFGIVTGSVLLVVGLGTITKTLELSAGGSAVATMLGGELLPPTTKGADERKLLNVVEEMSLASGVPVPAVYVLPDRTINAFAAGHGPGDTAVGVTRGCMEELSRDELQGVIAHEFSHILHGDMRLNVRLIGVLNGILFLSILGGTLLRLTIYMPRDRGGGSGDRKGGGLVAAMAAIGLAMYLAGWIGVFFGSLIKAAVSRQREFLADASAVQYTRNPDGIAGALWKIGQLHSELQSPKAAEASHMFFGNGVATSWFALFATHPPIDERIKAIAPGFQPKSVRSAPVEPPPLPSEAKGGGRGFGDFTAILPMAASLMQSLPVFALDAVRDLHGACTLVYALVLDHDADRRAAQLEVFGANSALRAETEALFNRTSTLGREARLPLVELAIPTLRQLSPNQYGEFREILHRLIVADAEINLFEFALQKTVIRHLDLAFHLVPPPTVKFRSVVPLLPDVSVVLSAIAAGGTSDPAVAAQAFAGGVRELLVKESSFPMQFAPTDLDALDKALDRIALAAPQVKRSILTAAKQVVTHDGVVSPEEYELLRAVADTIDCPMPMLPGA